jgi:general secretion pathway protein D
MLSLTLLAGCVQPAVREFDEGKKLLAEGKTQSGLASIDLAIKDEPYNPEYKSVRYKEREAAVNQILVRADSARANGQLDSAEIDYRKALDLDQNNIRATNGIQGVQSDRRRMAQLAEAKSLFEKGDREGAQSMLKPILNENPFQPGAFALQKRIDESVAELTTLPSALKLAIKKPITLEFQDASIKEVFATISRVAGLNFVFDKDIKPETKVTIFVKNTSIEEAIRLLLVTNQLEQEMLNESSVLIYPNTAAKSHDYQQLIVKSFYLANADVKKTMEMIKTILKTKDIFIDENLNLLVMRDTPEVIRLAEKLVATQDLSIPEVVLEVEVLETSTDFASNLGMQLATQVSASLVGAAGTAGSFTLNDLQNHNSSFYSFQTTNPALTLNLKKQDSDTTTLANPKIRVKDREKAKIHIGQRLPVLTTVSTAGVGSTETVNYLDVGLKLDVEPNIRLDDQVDMKVDLEVSSVVSTITSATTGSQVYELGTRNASTKLRLKDGETQILAGLLQNNETSAVNKIPGLGDVPLLGRLFSNDNRDKSKTELVLLITPHIVRNVTRPDAIYSEFPSGTENAIGSPPMMTHSMEQAQTTPAQLSVMPVQNQSVQTAKTMAFKPAEMPATVDSNSKNDSTPVTGNLK